MKKKTLLSVAVAAMLVAAMAVTAFAAPGSVSIDAPSSVDPGETFTVTVSGTGEGVNGSISASGATIDSVNSQLCSTNAFVLLPGSGMSSATYTLTATGSSSITITLSNCFAAEGSDAVSIDGASATVSINSGSEPTDEPTQTPTDEPTQTPSEQPSGEPSTSPSGSAAPSGSAGTGTGTGTGSGNQDKMPKTGDATMDLWVLAVIAAGCTGAAVVAGKKVFSHK